MQNKDLIFGKTDLRYKKQRLMFINMQELGENCSHFLSKESTREQTLDIQNDWRDIDIRSAHEH